MRASPKRRTQKVAFVVDKITWVMKRSSLCGYFEPNYDDLIIFESVLKFEFSFPSKKMFFYVDKITW